MTEHTPYPLGHRVHASNRLGVEGILRMGWGTINGAQYPRCLLKEPHRPLLVSYLWHGLLILLACLLVLCCLYSFLLCWLWHGLLPCSCLPACLVPSILLPAALVVAWFAASSCLPACPVPSILLPAVLVMEWFAARSCLPACLVPSMYTPSCCISYGMVCC